MMIMTPGFDQRKCLAENFGDGCCIVAHDRQIATSLRSIQCERADNDMATRTYGFGNPLSIGGAILCFRKEMQRRPVVPDVIGLGWLPRRHISNDPLNACPPRPKPALRCFQCAYREIENGDVRKSNITERIDETRGTPADVHNGSTGRDAG